LLIGILFFQISGKSARIEKVRSEAMKTDIPSINVITLTLEPTRLEDKINLPGEVKPAEELWVKAEVSGQVTRILVDEGQKVQKGQVLVELDDRDYQSRLARIEANFKAIQQDFDRYVALAEKKITAQNKLNEIEARYKDITAQREEASLALSRTRIIAPLEGRLNEMTPLEGDLLKAGDKVAQILDINHVKITVGVPESDVSAFYNLKESEVIIEALDNFRIKGKKIFLSYQPRSLARLYDLELLIENPGGRIRPGMFARVELVKKVYENALVVPLYAIISENNDQFVYLENGGHAKKRTVTLGIMSGWQVHVTSGISAGEKVIVVGHRQLKDGQPIEVIRNVMDAGEILSQ